MVILLICIIKYPLYHTTILIFCTYNYNNYYTEIIKLKKFNTIIGVVITIQLCQHLTF